MTVDFDLGVLGVGDHATIMAVLVLVVDYEAGQVTRSSVLSQRIFAAALEAELTTIKCIIVGITHHIACLQF